jgi:ribosomal protein L15E
MVKKSAKPWDKSAPKTAHHTKLTPKKKAEAKAAAKRAGRKYPNLVDNMNAVKK